MAATQFFVHMQGDTPIAVDKTGTPLPVQPTMRVSIDDLGEPRVIVLDSSGDPTGYQPPLYEIPLDFQVHMQGDTPVAVDETGTPLPVQPTMHVSVNADGEPLIAVSDASGNPTGYLPPLYEVPRTSRSTCGATPRSRWTRRAHRCPPNPTCL